MKRDNFMVSNNAVAAAYPPLDEVGRPPVADYVAVVNAFGLVACGRPVSSWIVSSPCPFGCSARVHTFECEVGYLPGSSVQQFEYCAGTDAFYSVKVPESLRRAAFDEVNWVMS